MRHQPTLGDWLVEYPWPAAWYTPVPSTAFEEDKPEKPARRPDQERLFTSQTLAQSSILCIGAGSVGREVSRGLARKGVGSLRIVDDDEIFQRGPPWQGTITPRAFQLAHRCARESARHSVFTGHAQAFHADTAADLLDGITLGIICLSDFRAQTEASYVFQRRHIPVVMACVNPRTSTGWIFRQDAYAPYFSCLERELLRLSRNAALGPVSPARLLRSVSGLALQEVDRAVMLDGTEREKDTVTFVRGAVVECRAFEHSSASCYMCRVERRLEAMRGSNTNS